MATIIYQILPFVRSHLGITASIIIGTIALTFFVSEYKERRSEDSESSFERLPDKEEFARKPVTISNKKNFTAFPRNELAEARHTENPRRIPIPQNNIGETAKPVVLTHLQYSSAKKPARPEPDQRPVKTLEPGSLILCQLANDLSSEQSGQPIIAIVRKEIHTGKSVIIPNNSRIYGKIASRHGNGRIYAETDWNVRTPQNVQLSFSGTMMAATKPQSGNFPSKGNLLAGISAFAQPLNKKSQRRALIASIGGSFARAGRTGVGSIIGFRADPNLGNLGRDVASDAADKYAEKLFNRLDQKHRIITSSAGQYFYIFVSVESAKNVGELGESDQISKYLKNREIFRKALD